MKLSQLISRLTDLQAQHGDLEVLHDDGYGHLHPAKPEDVGVFPTIRHPDPELRDDDNYLVRADRLVKDRPGHGGTRGMFIEPYQSIAMASPTSPRVVIRRNG